MSYHFTSYLVGETGFEPALARPQTECLTTRLLSDVVFVYTTLYYYSCQVMIFGAKDSNMGLYSKTIFHLDEYIHPLLQTDIYDP